MSDKARLSRDHYWNVLREIAGHFNVEIKVEADVDQLPAMAEDLMGDILKLEEEIEDHVCPIIAPGEPSDILKLKERIEEEVVNDVKIIRKFAV